MAWESAADDVGWVSVERFDVIVSLHIGPVFLQHSSAPRIDLNLPRNLVTGPLEAEVESAYASEEAADFQRCTVRGSGIASVRGDRIPGEESPPISHCSVERTNAAAAGNGNGIRRWFPALSRLTRIRVIEFLD